MVNQSFAAAFQVRATGTAPIVYQWHFNSVAIDGAVTNILTITNALPAKAGDYFAIVSNSTGSVTSRVAKLTVVPAAALDARVLTNLWLGAEPTSLPTNRLAQVEPHIARSFANTNLLAAVWMEGRHFTGGGAVACGYAVSSDGGGTWSRGLIPIMTTNTGGRFERTTDPTVGIDLEGNIYVCTLNFGTTGTNAPGSVVVSKSTDQGKSFGEPTVIFGTTNTRLEVDKPWMAVDDFPRRSTANRIAVGWTLLSYDASGNEVNTICQISVSEDQGKNWSAPLSIATNNVVFPTPLFLPDGSLAVLFQNRSFTLTEMVLSEDDGTIFNRRERLASYDPYWAPNVRQSGSAAVATDRLAGVLYVAYQANFGSGTNNAPRIVFTRSIDKGRTWSSPIPVNDTPNRRPVFNPAIAVSPDGQHVLIAFCDERHDSGAGFLVDLYLAESFDGGGTWVPNVRLTSFSSDVRKAPLVGSLYMLGDYHGIVPPLNFASPAWVAYCDTRSGNADPVLIEAQRTKGASYEGWGHLFWDSILAVGHHRDDDPDQDGLINQAEFAIGLNPTRPDASPFVVRRIPNPPGSDLLRVTVDILNATELSFSISIREESSNLLQWRPHSPTISNGPAAHPWFTRYQMDANIQPGDPMRYFKIGLCDFCR